LSPNRRNGQWTEEEDQLLSDKFVEFGAKWSVIVSFCPSRSEVNLKNRWTQRTNRGARDIGQEKQRVIRQLDCVIAGTAPPGRSRTDHEGEMLDSLDWEYPDTGQAMSLFMQPDFDDGQFAER
jgi:hypothetical protein